MVLQCVPSHLSQPAPRSSRTRSGWAELLSGFAEEASRLDGIHCWSRVAVKAASAQAVAAPGIVGIRKIHPLLCSPALKASSVQRHCKSKPRNPALVTVELSETMKRYVRTLSSQVSRSSLA
ncbi:hypothetical protein HPB50_013747 [Hyalomma asiaticum]|uniref:Uncharacterized protein n=1 Tax=Hyalomma asiaticum TaxID=266040 RepID=A0ACB7TK66_HYAAI|nr:hypothetical protein HPB50_013747 [Hyalomma asiaticum]